MMNRLMLLSFVIIATVGTIVGVGTQRVLAWMGPGPDDWGPTGCCSSSDSSFTQGMTGVLNLFKTAVSQSGYWNQKCCGEGYGPSLYQIGVSNGFETGWNHGVADAQYDHLHNLVYNNGGACLPCHSPVYWDGFHKGYDAQWNTYTNTEQNSQQTINNYINVHGNGNEVNLNDRVLSNQNQD